jgi:hypothetical protein
VEKDDQRITNLEGAVRTLAGTDAPLGCRISSPEEQSMRYDSLALAVRRAFEAGSEADADAIIADADKYANFIQHGKRTPATT